MKSHEIQNILIDSLPLNEVHVIGDSNYLQIIAISDIFSNISLVKRQQIIYAPLIKYITDNFIHAISIKTYTIKEWELNRNLNIFKQE